MSVPRMTRPEKPASSHITPSSSAPPDLASPTPGAAADSSDGIPSGRGRATALTDEKPPKK